MRVYSIEDIKKIIEPIAKAHDLEKVCLFGSYARGDATEKSDMDFLVYGLDYKRLAYFNELEEILKEKMKKSVDVVRAEDLREKMKKETNTNITPIKRFVKNIKKELVVIYERA